MEQYVYNGDVRIWTTISDNITEDNPYLCLCGGGPGIGDSLYDVDNLLQERFNIIRFEQRGCGRSGTDGNYSIEETLSDLKTIQKYYKIDKWYIGGHSWGAGLSLIYALEFSGECKGVIYISGMGFQNNNDWSEEFKTNSDNLDSPEFILPDGLSINYDVLNSGLRSFNKYIRKPMLFKDISIFSLPVLVLYGSDDIRPMWPAKQLANLLPQGTFKLFEETGHFIWEDFPSDFKETIFSWLDNIESEE